MSLWESWVVAGAPVSLKTKEERVEPVQEPDVSAVDKLREERALAVRDAARWRQIAMRLKAAVEAQLHTVGIRTEQFETATAQIKEAQARWHELHRNFSDLEARYNALKQEHDALKKAGMTRKKPKKEKSPTQAIAELFDPPSVLLDPSSDNKKD